MCWDNVGHLGWESSQRSFFWSDFPAFELNTERYGPEIWTRKTPNTDTFHAVRGSIKKTLLASTNTLQVTSRGSVCIIVINLPFLQHIVYWTYICDPELHVDEIFNAMRSYMLMKCMRNAFKSNARLKLAKKKANVKHHPELEFLLFENYSHSSSTLSTKTVEHILKNKQKKKSTNGHKFS